MTEDGQYEVGDRVQIRLGWTEVAPDGTKLTFTFDIGEDGEVQGCLATPYNARRKPNPKEYVWE